MAALSITATSVVLTAGQGSAIAVRLAAGVTVTAGQAAYSVGDGTYGLADSNAGSIGDAVRTFAGIYLSGGSPTQTVALCGNATTLTNGASGMTVGGAIYLMDTAGAITQTLADATGGTAVMIGIALTATTMSVISGGITGGTVA